MSTDPIDYTPDDDMAIGEGRDWLRDRVDNGATCPLCTQYAKVYRRKINTADVRGLVKLWHVAGMTYEHTPKLITSHQFAQLSWWELIEEEAKTRPDGGRAGYWRITERGRAWLFEEILVQKYARVYNGNLLNLTGPGVGIREALGTRFDLDDLMKGI